MKGQGFHLLHEVYKRVEKYVISVGLRSFL